MDFKEFGKQDGKTLLLLPGTACTWQLNFKNVVGELAEKHHIIAVNSTASRETDTKNEGETRHVNKI